jgi:hypothetical protein
MSQQQPQQPLQPQQQQQQQLSLNNTSTGEHQATEIKIGNRYRLGRKIGSGSFGEIFFGKASFTFKRN